MSNPNICERVDDLIGFLYGELSDIEARKFERHLCECAACATEFTAFGQIRESMVAWRNESLGLTRISDPSLAPAATQSGTPAKSAFAALREFFALSPVWMRGATAFAGVLFCVCAVLAVAYLKGRQPVTVNANADKIYSEKQFQARLAVELQQLRSATPSPSGPALNNADVRPNKSSVVPPSSANIVRNARRPFTQQERQELAADLRLVTSKDDDELDLVTESNRPTP